MQGHDLGEMVDMAQALSDQARLARALHARSEYHRLQGDYEAANEDARAALEAGRSLELLERLARWTRAEAENA